MKKSDRLLALRVLATMVAVSTPALATTAPASDAARLSSQYATWAGGKSNAESLVNGLRNGSSIAISTVSADNRRSIAGFTAQTRMSPDEVSAALTAARSSLARMGIRQPSADQIQAALIGGEITLPSGKTRLVQGSVALRNEPTLLPVSAR